MKDFGMALLWILGTLWQWLGDVLATVWEKCGDLADVEEGNEDLHRGPLL